MDVMRHVVCVCAGRSDGAERHPQIQEEVRHLSALQAYLNLKLGAWVLHSAFREQHVRILLFFLSLILFFCIVTIAKSCTETSLQAR